MKRTVDRLVDLLDIRDGWLGQGQSSEGKAPSPSLLVWAGVLLATLVERAKVPEPYIYPTPEGGLSVEWNGKGADLELTPDHKIQVIGWDEVLDSVEDLDRIVEALKGATP